MYHVEFVCMLVQRQTIVLVTLNLNDIFLAIFSHNCMLYSIFFCFHC